MNIEDRLRKLIVKYVEREELLDNLSEDSVIKDALIIDSLDMIELIIDIETEFEIRIADNEVERLNTLSDIKKLINQKTKEGAA
ncbi:MAG: phosphopantetheine-binding protein [Cyclobacteriaceae bacterium]